MKEKLGEAGRELWSACMQDVDRQNFNDSSDYNGYLFYMCYVNGGEAPHVLMQSIVAPQRTASTLSYVFEMSLR